MNERYIKLQMESVVNKILYKRNIVEKNIFEETTAKIDKMLYEEKKKITKNNLLEP